MGMIEKLNSIISRLKFLYQCGKLSGDAEFRETTLKGYHNPNYLKVNIGGNAHRGNIIYTINEYGSSVGFFAEFLYCLIRLYYASERGFIPRVNWGEGFLYYEEEGIGNEKNAFLHYFEPVSDVLCTDNVAYEVVATNEHIREVQSKLKTQGYAVSDEYIFRMSEMIKKYIRYNEKTMNYLEDEYRRLIGGRKALAVHFRGTDYRKQYNDHPVFISIEQEIAKVKEVFNKKGYEVIFLATDEKKAVEVFRDEFGDKLKVFEDVWRAEEGETVHYSQSKREQHHYLLGREVVRDQYMLTRCNGLVCGLSNLTLSARMMRKAWYDKEYDDLIIISNELYHNNRNFCDEKNK